MVFHAFARRIVFGVFLVAVILAATETSPAQKRDGRDKLDSNYVSVANHAVSVWVDTYTGEFWIERTAGDRILFAGEDGGTSAMSIYFNGATFTNNRLRAPQAPAGTVYMPDGIATVVDDTIVFAVDIPFRDASIELRQTFVPMQEGEYGFIRVTTSVKNTSPGNATIGIQNLFDLFLKDTDGPEILVEGNRILTESQRMLTAIPDTYRVSMPQIAWDAIARLRGRGTTPPDILIFGNWTWAGYLGAPAWNYTPSGLPLTHDCASLLQWNPTSLLPGETRTVVTDYGVDLEIRSSMVCMSDSLVLNAAENGYDPEPFRVVSHVANTGQTDLRNMQIQIALPAGIHLAPGETLTRTIVGPLGVGQSMPVSWNLLADTSGTARTETILTIIDNGVDVDTCTVTVYVPAIPYYALETLCPDDVYLELTPDRTSYTNELFTIVSRVRNVGNAPVNSITALLQPTQITPLDGSAEFQFLEPDLLLPGDVNSVSWQLRAIPQCKDTVITLNIMLQRMPFYYDTCMVQVHFPATGKTACLANGVLTRGTSYHSTLIANDAVDPGVVPQAVLYFLTDSISQVTVTENMSGFRYEFTVDECGMHTLVLSDSVNSLVFPLYEVVERRSVTITATYPVTVFAGSMRPLHSDATLLLPDHALGTEYVTVGYNYGKGGETEQFAFLATEDNTDIDYSLWARSLGGIPGKSLEQLSLNEDETFAIFQGLSGPAGGLTGSVLSSSYPIAVVGGMSSGHIPGWGRALDYQNPALAQIPPIKHLGKEYIVMPFRERQRGFTIRVVASEPGTTVMVGSQQITLTSKGDRYETQLLDPTLISADKPVLVAQYAHSASYDDPANEHGDSFMVVLPPADRFPSCHTFPTSLGSNIDSAGARFPVTYANLVVYAGGESQVSVNGLLLDDTTFHRLPGTIFSVATIAFPPGVQNIGTTDMRGIGVMVYAFEHHDAFGFISGYISGTPITGIEDVPVASSLLIDTYPVPATDHVIATVHTPERISGQLLLYDAMGRQQKIVASGTMKPGATQYHVDTHAYPAGTYFLVLNSADRHAIRRFTIIR